jgi:hypothetical protein
MSEETWQRSTYVVIAFLNYLTAWTDRIADSSALAAKEHARDIVAAWHGKTKYGKPMYQWNTYRAISRRSGVYKDQNWNKALAKPLEELLVVPWTRCFTGEDSAMAAIVSRFLQKCINAFNRHGQSLLQTAQTLGPAAHSMLDQQMQASVQAIMLLNGQIQSEIALKQQELNRMTSPNILISMQKVYDQNNEERGAGSFIRGKARMEAHIEGHKTS